MKTVFMGTPDFAVPCLKRLLDDGHDVCGVFSQPDRPSGRGYKLVPPPVKQLALEHGLPVFQPEKLRDGTALKTLRELSPELIVVVAYGRLLPPDILELPPRGCVNVHASLLPKLRGAAPIQWSVINGDEMTGVTTMYMAQGLDTGDIILRRETSIGPEETAGELFDRLSVLGAECLSETIRRIADGTAPRTPQDHEKATQAPPIDKSMAFLDFTWQPERLCNLVRGLNPSPAAKARLDGKLIRVLQARPYPGYTGAPGKILAADRFIVACGDGAVELLTVQPEGKKAMDGTAFIRGRRLSGTETLC